MTKIQLPQEVIEGLLELKQTKRVSLEGNILKVIDPGDNTEFAEYLKTSIQEDKDKQRRRLDITKQVQSQNKELLEAQSEKDALVEQIQAALQQAEESKENALKDLDVLQKKKQFELIGIIVKIALFIILGVGACTTILYIYSLSIDRDTELIGNTWSNMFGILLTNAFSIIGTIMGVKYASKDKE